MGRFTAHAFYFDLGNRMLPEIAGSDDAAQAHWVPIAELPALEPEFHDDPFHLLGPFLGITQAPQEVRVTPP